MKIRLALGVTALLGVLGCGGGGGGGRNVGVVANPFETCDPNTDVCDQGLYCSASTLPAATYSGYFCTAGCNSDLDCPQVINNYDAICVNQECFIQCPDGGANCPYGTQCLIYQDDAGNELDLCTP